jgi:hypothetical protein
LGQPSETMPIFGGEGSSIAMMEARDIGAIVRKCES